jgi:nickel/cobalt transporter (NicO) family protein
MRISRVLPVVLALASVAMAHDIPNERVDRSVQVTLLQRGRILVDYEVSLSELTLVQDLRRLVGPVEASDRHALFDRYGKETGPLNAKGLLVWVDGREIALKADHFDLAVEEHPRYTFHLSADVPPDGRLKIVDSNYTGSEGTSRLAIRGETGVVVSGDALPADVESIPIRPVWQLTNAEEKRTHSVYVTYSQTSAGPTVSPAQSSARPVIRATARDPVARRLSSLLDRAFGLPAILASLLAVALGAAHALQPGHGKTLVAATVVSHQGGPAQAVGLALVTTLTHMTVVVLIAGVLWWTQTTRYAEIHSGLARAAGVAIATIGFWKLGRHVAGHGEHTDADETTAVAGRSVIGLGIAGGLVPCWDAVILVIVADMVGRLAFGLALVAAFSVGMATVLVLVGLASARVVREIGRRERLLRWERGVGLASALVVSALGLWLMSGI